MSVATISVGDIIMMVPAKRVFGAPTNHFKQPTILSHCQPTILSNHLFIPNVEETTILSNHLFIPNVSTYNKTTYRDMAGKREGTDTKIP